RRNGGGGGYRGNRERRGNGDTRGNDRRRGSGAASSERRFGDYKRRDGRSTESRRNSSGGSRREFTVREKD
ncbi:MAG: ATP-dependent RNA helicase, partial [Leuconostoc mesenteroides]